MSSDLAVAEPLLDPAPLGEHDLGRTRVSSANLAETTELLVDAAIVGDEARLVVTANLQHLRVIREDAVFATAYDRAFLRTADGAPVLALAKVAGVELPGRVTGSDLVPALCARAAELGLMVQFVGGSHGVAEKASAVARRTWPGLRTAKPLCPPWGFHLDPEQNAQLVRDINAGGAHFVFMCLGAPKQEKWVSEHLDRLRPAVFVGAGATVDFIAGTVERAPEFWQRLNLEFLYRLLQEPRRLGMRYLRDFLAVPRLVVEAYATRFRRAEAVTGRAAAAQPHGRRRRQAA